MLYTGQICDVNASYHFEISSRRISHTERGGAARRFFRFGCSFSPNFKAPDEILFERFHFPRRAALCCSLIKISNVSRLLQGTFLPRNCLSTPSALRLVLCVFRVLIKSAGNFAIFLHFAPKFSVRAASGAVSALYITRKRTLKTELR